MPEGHFPGVSPVPAPGGAPAGSVTEEQVREELSRVLACHDFAPASAARISSVTSWKTRSSAMATCSRSAPSASKFSAGHQLRSQRRRHRPRKGRRGSQTAGPLLFRSGSHNPVRIELPSGTYVPEFHLVNAPPPAPAGRSRAPAPDTLPVPPPAAPSYRVLDPATAALAALVLLPPLSSPGCWHAPR